MELAVAGAEDTALHVEWEPLWSALKTEPWTVLAVVGTDTSAEVTRVAELLASVGNREGERCVRVVSAINVTPPQVPAIVEQLSDASRNDDRLVVPCDPPGNSSVMLPILKATSGAVLVVRLGASRIASAKKVVDIVGPDRIFATVAIG